MITRVNVYEGKTGKLLATADANGPALIRVETLPDEPASVITAPPS